MKQVNWYQIFGNTHKIPDGRTVEPTDDIQIWLNCANIWDKTYTTLAEVLADTDTLLALISSNNAVDYMVRSTTWATQITVPTMTSNTAPSGECFASTVYNSSYPAWKAFDGNDATDWNASTSDSVNNCYLGYEFTSPVCITKLRLMTATWGSGTRIAAFKVQGYDTEWEDIYSVTGRSDGDTSYTFDNAKTYSKYRILVTGVGGNPFPSGAVNIRTLQFYTASITTDSNAMTYIGQNNYCANTLLADATWCNAICNSTYFESVLNVKVPFMTSATTPEGEAFGTTEASYYPWKAFNGTNSSAVDMWYATIPSTVGYKFTRTVKVVRADITGRNTDNAHMYSVRNFVVQGSNDDFVSDVNDLGSFTNTDNSPRSFHNYIFANNAEYQSYRLSVSSCNKPASGDPNCCAIGMLQFYGRKDI